MYETRQHKDKVSRRIDGGGSRQMVKIDDKNIVYSSNKRDKTIQKRGDLAKIMGLAGGAGLAGVGIGTGFLIHGPIGALVGGLIGGGLGSILGALGGKQIGYKLPPFTSINVRGKESNNERSYATVESNAELTGIDQRVIYEIKWGANVVPAGNHLNQNTVPPNTYVEDKAPNGVDSVGDRNSPIHHFFRDQDCSIDDPNGLYFHYNDGIEQESLQGGSWWFRIRVIDRGGSTLSSSEVEIQW